MILITTLLLFTTITGSGIVDQPVTEQEQVEEVKQIEEDNTVPQSVRWTGKNFNENETRTLEFLQDQGITDKMALAVIMGNIRQESTFHPNICEGGKRVSYQYCSRGGYGIVQWTTSGRYWGLGAHAKKINGDPSSLDTQLSYMVTETEWKRAKKMFVTPDKSLDYYMKAADIWLGWGIYGNRGYYSQQYFDSLSMT